MSEEHFITPETRRVMRKLASNLEQITGIPFGQLSESLFKEAAAEIDSHWRRRLEADNSATIQSTRHFL